MDGRMYRVPRLESYPLFNFKEDGTAYEQPYDYTDYEVYSDLMVPNGTWVMKRPCYEYSWLVGVTWNELRDISIDKRPGQQCLLYMAEKPFGFVGSEEAEYLPDTYNQVPIGPQHLSYARQIHKGELGQGVPIPRLQFAREHPNNARKMHRFERNRDQRRNPFRWARLSDAVKASGMSAHQLVTNYWPFVGRSHDSFQKPYFQDKSVREVIHLRHAIDHAQISRQIELPLGLTRERMQASVLGGDRSVDRFTWIRAGLANTFLRLCALGYQPAAMPVT